MSKDPSRFSPAQKLLHSNGRMDSVVLQIQTGLLAIAALNLLLAVWLLYRQLRMEEMLRSIAAKGGLVSSAESKSAVRLTQTTSTTPRMTNLVH